jgi:hypothetical protein
MDLKEMCFRKWIRFTCLKFVEEFSTFTIRARYPFIDVGGRKGLLLPMPITVQFLGYT